MLTFKDRFQAHLVLEKTPAQRKALKHEISEMAILGANSWRRLLLREKH
jgi:hypothetical protein